MSNDMSVDSTANSLDSRRCPIAPPWLYGAVLLVIAMAPSQLSWSPDPKHGPFIAYGDAMAALVIALWALWRLRSGLSGLLWPPMAVGGMLLVALLSAGMAESPKLTALILIQIALYFAAAYMLFADVLTDKSRIKGALLALALPTAVNLGLATSQYFTAETPFEVGALLSNRNVYSAYMAIVLPLGFGIWLWVQQRPAQWALGAVMVLGAVTMLSPPLVWVALLVMAVQTWFASRPASYRGALVVLATAVLVVVLPRNHDIAVQELLDAQEEGPLHKLQTELGEVEEDSYIVKKRWLEWMPALNMMAENFMLGVGGGNFQLNIGRSEYYGFLPNVRKSEPDTNNLYLVVGSSMGFAGLICLVAYIGRFWTWALALVHRIEPGGWMTGLAVGLAGSVAALTLVNIFTSVFVRGTGLVWALLFAIIGIINEGRIASRRDKQLLSDVQGASQGSEHHAQN